MENITKTNVEEIVAFVIYSLERAKEGQSNRDIKTVKKSDGQFDCYKCNFKYKDKWSMIMHMRQEHGECSSCELCATY